MNQQLARFTSLAHYKEVSRSCVNFIFVAPRTPPSIAYRCFRQSQNLAHSILPMVNDKFESVDGESARLLQNFFLSYGMLATQCVD